MNLKRGISIAVVLYIVTLVVGVAITLTIRSKSIQITSQTGYWMTTLITTILLTSVASIWYFAKAKRSTLEGFKLGITFAITGFIIDSIIFLSQPGGFQLIKEYYSNVAFYIVLLLVLATCVFIGSQEGMIKQKPINQKIIKKTKSKKKKSKITKK